MVHLEDIPHSFVFGEEISIRNLSFNMALGTSLSNILELNLNENFNKEIKVLAASIQSKKTQFTRFLGAEDLSSEGLLLSRVDLWIKSVTNYPVLNKSQSQVIKELLSKIVVEAMSLKNSLCQAYFDLTQKISTLSSFNLCGNIRVK